MRPNNVGSGSTTTLALVAGLAITGVGLFLVGLYAVEAWRAIGQPDSSMLFWMLPILFLGSMISVLGGLLGWVAWRARRGDPQFQALAAKAVKTLALILAIVIPILVVGSLLQQR